MTIINTGAFFMKGTIKLLFLLSAITIHAHGQIKKALITGITGQDGSYLAEFLLEKGYQVHGLVRRSSSLSTRSRIDHLSPARHDKGDFQFYLHYGDLADSSSLMKIIDTIKPDEIYNLGAQSHVKVSFEMPEFTADIDALGTLRLLEAIKALNLTKKTKFYQASTCELFGLAAEIPQTEKTEFHPRSPYAVAKLYAHWITVNYREAYGMYACNGILFNHESPRRGENFVTRKITMAVARISRGQQKVLYLGNFDAKCDWGYAKDYVEAMWLMLQQEKPDDFVIATGETHSVREFVEEAFKNVDIPIIWQGTGHEEVGINRKTGDILVKVDPAYFRPIESNIRMGDPSKALKAFGWRPKTKFTELVKIMVESDLASLA